MKHSAAKYTLLRREIQPDEVTAKLVAGRWRKQFRQGGLGRAIEVRTFKRSVRAGGDAFSIYVVIAREPIVAPSDAPSDETPTPNYTKADGTVATVREGEAPTYIAAPPTDEGETPAQRAKRYAEIVGVGAYPSIGAALMDGAAGVDKAKLLQLWFDALVSEKYKQGTGALLKIPVMDPANPGKETGLSPYDGEPDESRPYYCCLGVLCDLVDPEGWLPITPNKSSGNHYFRMFRLMGTDSTLSEEQGGGLPGRLRTAIGMDSAGQEECVRWNDSLHLTFKEIARRLQNVFVYTLSGDVSHVFDAGPENAGESAGGKVSEPTATYQLNAEMTKPEPIIVNDVDIGALLARVPDEVVLAIASQDFDQYNGQRCIVGWAVREEIARLMNVEPETISSMVKLVKNEVTGKITRRPGEAMPYVNAATLYGGTWDDWEVLYTAAGAGSWDDDLERTPEVDQLLVEAAWAIRVDEAVARSISYGVVRETPVAPYSTDVMLHEYPRDVNLTRLFAGIPDEVAIAAAGRDFFLSSPFTCLVGWVVREHLGRLMGQDPASTLIKDALYEGDTLGADPVSKAESAFGGSYSEWNRVFYGVTRNDDLIPIEQAWNQRLLKAGMSNPPRLPIDEVEVENEDDGFNED